MESENYINRLSIFAVLIIREIRFLKNGKKGGEI